MQLTFIRDRNIRTCNENLSHSIQNTVHMYIIYATYQCVVGSNPTRAAHHWKKRRSCVLYRLALLGSTAPMCARVIRGYTQKPGD